MSGWTTKKLGEVCESISTRGCQIQQNEICDIGKFPVVSQSEAFIEGYTDFENAIENIPVVLFGDHTCCVKYIDFPFVVGADGTKLLTAKQFEVKFLYYAILKISSSLVDGKYRRHFKDLKKCDIPIPPLAEQKRIVAKIDAAFEKIDRLKANAEKNLANAKELFQSALDEAMRPKKGWVEKRLGEVYEITSSKRVFKSEWKTAGVPFYRAREIVKLAANGFVKNELFVSEEMYETYAQKYGIPKAGDIMITGVGTLGVCYVVKEDDKFYFKDGNIIWLKKCSNDVDSKFISLAFSTSPVRKQVLANAGTTVGTYTIIMAKNTVVQMPTIVEQKKIVNYVTGLRRQIEILQQNYERQIADCAEMRQAILREAFEGRL